MLQVKADLFCKVDRVDICDRIASRAQNGNCVQIERRRHHIAFARIRMLSDEIDTTRRLIGNAIRAKTIVMNF